jgi:hypothetical protein
MKSTARSIAGFLLVYLGWIASAALGGYALLVFHQTIVGTFDALVLHSWARGAVYQFSIVILGLIWLAGVLLLEDYYRNGLHRGALGRRFVRVTLGEVALLAVLLVVGLLVSARVAGTA